PNSAIIKMAPARLRSRLAAANRAGANPFELEQDMRLGFFPFLLPLAALAACATVPTTTPAAPQISLPTLQRVTQTLSSDEFQGRAPGTEGETRTVAFLSREFQRAGLTPGNHGSWYQDVPLVEITLQGSPALHVTGPNNTNLNFAYRTDYIGASYRA